MTKVKIPISGEIKNKRIMWRCRNHKRCRGDADEKDGLCKACLEKYGRPQQQLGISNKKDEKE